MVVYKQTSVEFIMKFKLESLSTNYKRSRAGTLLCVISRDV